MYKKSTLFSLYRKGKLIHDILLHQIYLQQLVVQFKEILKLVHLVGAHASADINMLFGAITGCQQWPSAKQSDIRLGFGSTLQMGIFVCVVVVMLVNKSSF